MRAASLAIIAILIVVLLAATADAGSPGGGDDKGSTGKPQVGFWSILINGRAVTGPNSLAQTRDGRLMVPISTIARILGDRVILDVDKQQISVVRQSGTSASFNLRQGQITENGSVVLDGRKRSPAIAFHARHGRGNAAERGGGCAPRRGDKL